MITVLTFLLPIVHLYSTECLIMKCIDSSRQGTCIMSEVSCCSLLLDTAAK
jgi:hypothetical protein